MFKIKIDPEQMRYKPNNFSFWLCILAIAFNILHFIIIYSSKTITPDYVIGIDVFVNIVFMLFIFLASVKTQAYSIGWSYAVGGIAVIELLRIFIVPLRFNLKKELVGLDFVLTVVFLVASSVCLTLASVVCWIRGKVLQKYFANLDADKGEAS
mgnify:CR=1 FL=1|jgi:hypothetical protein